MCGRTWLYFSGGAPCRSRKSPSIHHHLNTHLLLFQQPVQRSTVRRRSTRWCQRHSAPHAASPPAAHHWTSNRASRRLLSTPRSSTKPTDQEEHHVFTQRSHWYFLIPFFILMQQYESNRYQPISVD